MNAHLRILLGYHEGEINMSQDLRGKQGRVRHLTSAFFFFFTIKNNDGKLSKSYHLTKLFKNGRLQGKCNEFSNSGGQTHILHRLQMGNERNSC